MSRAEQIKKYVSDQLKIQTGMKDNQLQIYIENPLTQQVLNQVKQVVFISVLDQCVYDQLRAQQMNLQGFYAITSSMEALPDQFDQTMIAHIFQVFPLANLQSFLLTVLQPLTHNIHFQKPTIEQQEFQQSLSRFTDELKVLNSSNILNHIPYIVCDFHLRQQELDKDTVIGYITGLIDQIQQLSNQKLPLYNVKKIELLVNLTTDYDMIQFMIAQAEEILLFYFKFLERLQKCVNQAQSILNDQSLLSYIKDLTLKYQSDGDTSFNKYLAQFEYMRSNFKCNTIDIYFDLYEQLKIAIGKQIINVNIVKVLDFIKNYDLTDLVQMRQIYSALYIIYAKQILNMIKNEISVYLLQKSIQGQQIDQQVKNRLQKHLKAFLDSKQSEDELIILVPNLFMAKQALSMNVKNQVTIFQKFEEQILNIQKLNFEVSHGIIQLMNQISLNYNNYSQIISDIKQLQVKENFEKLIQRALQNVQFLMCRNELQRFLADPDGFQIQKLNGQQLSYDGDVYFIQFEDINFADQFDALLCNVFINVKQIYFDNQQNLLYKQLNNNQEQYIELEQIDSFNMYIKQFDHNINLFLDQLQPKYNDFHTILQQFSKIYRLNQISKSRNDISSKYVRIVSNITKQLTNVLQKVIYEAEQRTATIPNKVQFPFYDHLDPKQKVVLNNYLEPLQLFQHNDVCPLHFSLDVQDKIKQLRLLQEQTGDQNIGKLIDKVGSYGCTFKEMVEASSFCGQYLRNLMSNIADKELFQFKASSVICIKPYQYEQIETDYLILKTKAFNERLDFDFQKPYAHDIFNQILQIINTKLTNSIQIFNFVFEQLNSLSGNDKENDLFSDIEILNNNLLRENITQLFYKDLEAAIQEIYAIPQYFVKISSHDAIFMNINQALQKKSNVYGFYDFIYNPQLQQIQKYTINNVECNTIKINQLFQSAVERLEKITDELYQKFNDMIVLLQEINHECNLLKVTSQNTITDGVNAIVYNLKGILDLFNIDYSIKHQMFENVQKIIFEVLFNKTIMLLYVLYKKTKDIQTSDYNEQMYRDIVEPYIEQQPKELYLNALQCMEIFLEDHKDILNIQIEIQNNQFTLIPNIHDMTVNILTIGAQITQMFLGFKYVNLSNIQCTYYTLLQDEVNTPKIDIMKKVYGLLSEHLDKYCMKVLSNCQNFVKALENQAILVNSNSLEILRASINTNIMQWLEQYTIVSQDNQISPTYEYGIITIQCENSFLSNYQQNIANIKDFIGTQIKNIANQQLVDILQRQEELLQLTQTFSESKIRSILQSMNINERIYQLLDLIFQINGLNDTYVSLAKQIDVILQKITFQEIVQHIAQGKQQNDILIQWLAQTCEEIIQSQDFNNLLDILKKQDILCQQQGNQIISTWTDVFTNLQAKHQCNFGKIQEDLQEQLIIITELIKQIRQLFSAVSILSTIYQDINLNDYKSQLLINNLENIENDCKFNINVICTTLNNIYSQFAQKTSQKYYSYSQEDIILIVKQFSEMIKGLDKNIKQSLFYDNIFVYSQMIQQITQVVMPICNSSIFKKRHFLELQKQLSLTISNYEQLTLIQLYNFFLQDIISQNSQVFRQRINVSQQLLQIAQGQYVIEKSISEIDERWKTMQFTIYNNGNVALISKWNLLTDQMQEDIATLEGLQTSPYYADFKQQSNQLSNILNALSEIFAIWIITQKKWVHLSSVFTQNNQKIMTGHLLQVSLRYQQADSSLKNIMNEVISNPTINNVLNDSGFSQKLEHINNSFDLIQKQLNKFLEEQRSKSPRLFFIGDEDLLDIISCSSKMELSGLQKHWKKLFNGVDRVLFKDQDNDAQTQIKQSQQICVLGIKSQHDEEIIFKQSVIIENGGKDLIIHQIIKQIEQQLEISVKEYIFMGIQLIQQNQQIDVEKLLNQIPIQCLIVSFGVQWTYKVNQFLQNMSKIDELKEYYDSLLQQCVQLTIEKKYLTINQNVLISQLTYYKNTIQEIYQAQNPQLEFELTFKYTCNYQTTNSLTDFNKLQSVKSINYTQFSISCLVGQNILPYSYEYHGNDHRIVQTKLTNFCYLIGTNAIMNQFGCAPQGRAGSGKTESTKALGILLGRPVLVFNTDENFNEVAVGRILVGACEVGALVVFDEFNRLEENTLSAVSLQLTQIQHGLKEKQKSIPNFITSMEKRDINLNTNTAIFITLNPGYAGRRELPDTLKVLMRDVAMNQPDLMQIIEVMLSSNGFLHATMLSNKIITFFQLSSEQMTNQPHYDWGLRAIKTVLTSARIIFNQQNSKKEQLSLEQRFINEETAIVNSLLTQVFPKLVQEDIQVFNSLISDIFKRKDSQYQDDKQILEIINEIIRQEHNLVNDNEFIQKVLQIYRCQFINTGIILVGPTATGKSSTFKIFLQFIQKIQQLTYQQENGDSSSNYQFVQYETLYPKSYSNKEVLFGSFDDTTHEWSDGQFTKVLRKFLDDNSIKTNTYKHYYIVFDSVIDPEWVESLNSVLDDNKCLTLPNGERLAIPSNIHLIFEVQDLKNATLATVSRCSIIWYSENLLPLSLKFSGFINKLKKQLENPINYKDLLQNCINVCAIEQWRQIDQEISKNIQWGSFQELYYQLQDYNILTNDIMGNFQQRYLTTAISILKTTLYEIYEYIDEQFASITQRLQLNGITFDKIQDSSKQVNEDQNSDGQSVQLQTNSKDDILNNYYKVLQYAEINIQGICTFLRRRFVLAITWCFCSSLQQSERGIASAIITHYLVNNLPQQLFDGIKFDQNIDLLIENYKQSGKYQGEDTNSILYYNTNLKHNSAWEHYSTSLQKVRFVESQVGSVVVQTAETLAQNFLISSWLRSGTTFCLVGPAGSGKSMGLQSALSNMYDIQTVFISFSSHTSPEYLQKIIFRHTKKVYRNNNVFLVPIQEGQKLIFLCDEINLPKPDLYGCQRTIEFIRTLIEGQQFYDPSTQTNYYVKNIYFTGTCNPPTDPGRYHMDARFMSHCPSLLCDFPTSDSLLIIYTTFLEAIFEKRCKHFIQYAQNVAQTMVDIYKQIITTLTIEKQDHYIYSPRELTRQCRGLIVGLSNQDSDYLTYDLLVKLLYHETQRIFIDKIVDNDDKVQMIQATENIISKNMNIDISQLRNIDNTPLLFTFLDETSHQQKYTLTNVQDLQNWLTLKQKDYYDEQVLSDPSTECLILSDEVINMVVKIDRVLKQPVGHLLLIGLSGIGKTAISKFVGWINKFQVYQLSIHSKYTLQDFEELLREMIHKAAIQDTKVLFLFDEENVAEITFLEHLNALLAAGDIPGLFEGENQMQLYQQARNHIMKIATENIENKQNNQVNEMTDEEVQKWITEKVQINLHVIFSVNTVNMIKSQQKTNQVQTISSPALFNRCVIIWVNDWSCSSYLQIANNYIQQLQLQQDEAETQELLIAHQQKKLQLSQPGLTFQQIKTLLLDNINNYPINIRIENALTMIKYEIEDLMKSIESQQIITLPKSLSNNIYMKICTPRHFIRCIKLFLVKYFSVIQQEQNKISHILKGLKTLKETNKSVEKSQQQLNQQTKLLVQAQAEADQALQAIVERKSQVQKQQQEVEGLLQSIQQSESEIEDKKKPIHQKLQEVEPEIQAAKQAIKGIEKKNLDELKQLQRPPDLVLKAIQAVVLLIGNDAERADLSWESMRRVLRRPDFLKTMLEYDVQMFQLPAAIYKQLQENYVKSINPQSVGRASSAAGPMFQWVLSVFKYQEIHKNVEPLMVEIHALETEQKILKQKHKESQNKFKILDDDIKKFEAEYKQMFTKQQQLSHQKETTEKQLAIAQELLTSLQVEKQQWEEQESGFQEILKQQIGSQILISVFSIYGLSLPQQAQDSLINLLIQILDVFNIKHNGKECIKQYTNDIMRQLRSLSQSSDNDIDDSLLEKISTLFQIPSTDELQHPETEAPCLLLDVPDQIQMSKGLKTILGENAIITSAKSQDFIQNIQRALKLGKYLIVVDVDQIDTTLSNIIDFAASVSTHMILYGIQQGNKYQQNINTTSPNTQQINQLNRKQTQVQSENYQVKQIIQTSSYINKKLNVNGIEVESSGQFRIYLICTSSNQKIIPSIVSKTQILYCGITVDSFAQEIQQILLSKECPKLTAERRQVAKNNTYYQDRLVQLQKKLLSVISNINAQKLLEDENVKLELQNIQKESSQIKQKQQHTIQLQENLYLRESLYESTALFISELFFLIQKLKNIIYSGNYNLDFFMFIIQTQMHSVCITEEEAGASSEETLKRMQKLAQNITKDVYLYVGCTLPEIEKQSFALGLITLINSNPRLQAAIKNNDIEQIEQIDKTLMFTGIGSITGCNDASIEKVYEAICQKIDKYQKVDQSFVQQLQHYQQNDEEVDIANQISEQNCIQLMALTVSLQPLLIPRIIPQIFNYAVLENTYHLPNELQFKQLVTKFQGLKRPFLIIVTGYSDPLRHIQQVDNNKKIIVYAIGQKECNPSQIKQSINASPHSCVLVIQNMHLASYKVQQELYTLSLELLQGTKQITVVFTTMLTPLVTEKIYSGCIKYCLETPTNLSLQYTKQLNDIEQYLVSKQIKNKSISNLCALIVLIHSIITIRSRYISTGFIKDYEYTNVDLQIAVDIVLKLLQTQLQVQSIKITPQQFDVIQQYVLKVSYANKVVYNEDVKIMELLIKQILNSEQYAQSKPIEILEGLTIQQVACAENKSLPNEIKFVGLQPVSEKLYYQKKMQNLINKYRTLVMSGTQTANNDESTDQLIAQLNEWKETYLQLPAQVCKEVSNVVLMQVFKELQQCISNIHHIRNEIYEIIQYLKRESKLTTKIMSLLHAILSGVVPPEWKRFSNIQSNKLNHFLEDLKSRTSYLSSLIQNEGEIKEVNLAMFYHPSSFLTVLKQYFARKMDVSLDALIVSCSLQQNSSQKMCVLLKNIKAMFASVEGGKLVCKNKHFSDINEIVLGFGTESQKPLSDHQVPLYINTTRQQLLLNVDLEHENIHKSILNNVCFVLTNH